MEFKTNETQLVCIAKFIANPGEESQLLESLYNLIDPSTKEGGCIRYELNQCIDDPCRITFIDKWYDQTTFEKHNNSKHITAFFNNGKPKYVKEFEVTVHKEILK